MLLLFLLLLLKKLDKIPIGEPTPELATEPTKHKKSKLTATTIYDWNYSEQKIYWARQIKSISKRWNMIVL